MKQVLLAAKDLVALIETCRGSAFCLVGLGIFSVLPDRLRAPLANLPKLNINAAFASLFGLIVITALLYLTYPDYLDHMEPTIATLGQVLARGDNLYPLADYYPYHGLLYGPGLAISQWIVSGLGLPILIASKLPGVIAFLCSIPIMWKLGGNSLARGYFLLLLPFGSLLFWNRAEPLLLLLVCLALLFASSRPARWQLAMVVGLLAGVASALKIHGAVYVLVAYLAVSLTAPITVLELFLIGAVALPAFLCFFASSNISIEGYYTYLRLAKDHGLSIRVWAGNIFFLAFMLTPVAMLWRRESSSSLWKLLAIVFGEFLISVLAAKPGAGSHHLLPFIPVNAYVIQQLCVTNRIADDVRIRVLYACVVVPAVLSVLTILISTGSNWARQSTGSTARQELLQFDERYGPLLMGVSDTRGYGLSHFRVELRGEQIDYGAYMDLALSGVKPVALAERMKSCAIGKIVLPRDGEPFSMDNFYTNTPLFPDSIRLQFRDAYEKVQEGQFFSVYSCKPGHLPSSAGPK